MKKLGKKLSLERQTLRKLTSDELANVGGGRLDGAWACSRSPSGCSTYDDSLCCDMPSYGAPCITEENCAYQ